MLLDLNGSTLSVTFLDSFGTHTTIPKFHFQFLLICIGSKFRDAWPLALCAMAPKLASKDKKKKQKDHGTGGS